MLNRYQCKRAIAWHKARGERPGPRVGHPPFLFPAWQYEMQWRRSWRSTIRRFAASMSELAGAFVRAFAPVVEVFQQLGPQLGQLGTALAPSQPPAPDPGRPGFTCPVCHRTSYNPNDIREGWCSACSAWTGDGAAGTASRQTVGGAEDVNLWPGLRT